MSFRGISAQIKDLIGDLADVRRDPGVPPLGLLQVFLVPVPEEEVKISPFGRKPGLVTVVAVIDVLSHAQLYGKILPQA